MTKILQLFCFVSTLSLLPAANVSAVGNTREDGEVPAFSAKGKTTIQTAEALVDVHLAGGTPSKGDFIVLFDPETGRFLWTESTHAPDAPFDLILARGIAGSSHWAMVSSPSACYGCRHTE